MISYREKNFLYSYNKMTPKAFSAHLHKFYEFLYFADGEASYIVEGNEYKARKGDLFVTSPGEMHAIVFSSSQCYERYFVQISDEYLADTDVDFLSRLRRKPFGKNNKIPCGAIPSSELLRLFDAIGKNVVSSSPESRVLAKTYVIQLVSQVNAAMDTLAPTHFLPENDRIVRAKAYILQNLDKNLSLDAVADAAFTDKYYLSHLFRKETGMPLKDYIAFRRILLAKKLVAQGNSPTKIYSECGFCDYSSFYRAIKRFSGKSPSEFFKIRDKA